ncbi:MAG: hypothetical protein K2N30_03340 [Clostridia bacterium]|nr:hypothetical protein [Clostridia bacterium]
MKEQNKTQQIQKEIARLRRKLDSSLSPIGDWKGIKQREYIDAGRAAPYSAVEMQKYYNERFAVRQQINKLEKELEEEQSKQDNEEG